MIRKGTLGSLPLFAIAVAAFALTVGSDVFVSQSQAVASGRSSHGYSGVSNYGRSYNVSSNHGSYGYNRSWYGYNTYNYNRSYYTRPYYYYNYYTPYYYDDSSYGCYEPCYDSYYYTPSYGGCYPW